MSPRGLLARQGIGPVSLLVVDHLSLGASRARLECGVEAFGLKALCWKGFRAPTLNPSVQSGD